MRVISTRLYIAEKSGIETVTEDGRGSGTTAARPLGDY